jgi:uncharacterized RDD family membrane protein YckC
MSIVVPPLSGDPLAGILNLPRDRTIGSLWRRIVAFLVDGIIVGIAGTVVALPFFDALSRLGGWGRFVGFSLAFPYFAILNSKIGDGQTLGKRWMHLQVVDAGGNTIPFLRSCLRYSLFAAPYYLNQIVLPVSKTPWIVSSAISLIIFAVGGATFYLVLFNRHTRQGIHDLAARSYVADADTIGPPKVEPIWRIHKMILASVLVVLFVAVGILGSKAAKSRPFSQMLEDIRVIEEMEGVQAAGVSDLTWHSWGGGQTRKIFVVNVFWTGTSGTEEAFADSIAKQVLQHDSTPLERDARRVILARGYDLGIAHAQVSRAYEHSPAEWNARLFGTGTADPRVPAKL